MGTMSRTRAFTSRLLALAALCGVAACNLVVGIEPVSGTAQDDFAETCLAVINENRMEQGLAPLARWLENEACAQGFAKDLATLGTAEDACGDSSAAFCSWPKGSNQTMLESCFADDTFGAGDSKLACASFDRGDGKVQIVALLH